MLAGSMNELHNPEFGTESFPAFTFIIVICSTLSLTYGNLHFVDDTAFTFIFSPAIGLFIHL